MNPSDILERQEHRPFKLPEGKWVMRQVWHDLLLAHWPIEEKVIAPYMPKELQLDLWEGSAWMSISPFFIRPLQLRWLPPLPFARSFFELNMRTYVTYKQKPGVYFFSLDASSRLAVEAARFAGLPYVKAAIDMQREQEKIFYSCQRTDRRAQSVNFTGVYYPTSNKTFQPAANSQLYWLTERYRLYTTTSSGSVLAIDIHHLPWQFQLAQWDVVENTMGELLGIRLPDEAAILTYSKHQDVLIWPIKKV